MRLYVDFFIFVRFLYVGECKIDLENVEQILDCAEKYTLEQLKDVCYNFLACNLTPDTIWQIFYVADLYLQYTDLRPKCFDLYESNSARCLESHFIINLPANLLREIVIHDCVTCTEEKIYEVCFQWAANKMKKKDDKNIRELLLRNDILYNIRYRWISKNYFEKKIANGRILSVEETTSIRRSMNGDNESDDLFNHNIRRPKLHRLIRCKPRFNNNWRVGKVDAIDICFKGVVLLQGIIVFGTISGESSYKVDVCISDCTCDDNQRKLSVVKITDLKTNDKEPFNEVLLKNPVKLKSNKKYTIELCMEGSCTVTGIDYETEVDDGTFEVSFHNSSRSFNGTWTNAGQIPGVIVSNTYDS